MKSVSTTALSALEKSSISTIPISKNMIPIHEDSVIRDLIYCNLHDIPTTSQVSSKMYSTTHIR